MNTRKKGFLNETFHLKNVYCTEYESMITIRIRSGLPPNIHSWFPNGDLAPTSYWKLPIIGIFVGGV